LVGCHCPVSAWKAFVKAGQRDSAVFFGFLRYELHADLALLFLRRGIPLYIKVSVF